MSDAAAQAKERAEKSSQILAHLQSQLAELDRREQHVNQQMALLLEQQRSVETLQTEFQSAAAHHQRAQHEEAERLKNWDTKLAEQEASFAAREEAIRNRESEIDSQAEELEQRQASLQKEEDALSESREQWEPTVANLDQREQDLLARENAVKEFDATHELRQKKLDDDSASLDRQRQFWEKEQEKFAAQQKQREDAIAEKEADLEQRLTAFQEREAAVEEQRNHLTTARTELDEERARLREELTPEAMEEKAAVAEARRQLDADVREQKRLNEQWATQRTQERTDHLAELDAVRKERLAALDQRERELERRSIDVDKRSQLHESHLDRKRDDLKAQQSQLEQQRQRQTVWSEEVESSIRLRLAHMRRFRDVMAQREQCLQDEQSAFETMRNQFLQEKGQTRARFETEQEHWNQQRDAETERLDKRRGKLDDEFTLVRSAVEQIHALRDAYEKEVARLSTVSNDDAKSSDVPPAMPEHLTRLQSLIQQHHCDLDETAQLLQRLHQGMKSEASTFTEWLDGRERRLQEREDNLSSQFAEWLTREETWHADRDQWNTDRTEAEQVIRTLIQQLETALDELAVWEQSRSILESAETDNSTPESEQSNAA